jgi:hypothetical protein
MEAGQEVLDARAAFPDNTLADLYSSTSMPPLLRKAHTHLDKAVQSAFGLRLDATEERMLEVLFANYSEATEGLLHKPKATRTPKVTA